MDLTNYYQGKLIRGILVLEFRKHGETPAQQQPTRIHTDSRCIKLFRLLPPWKIYIYLCSVSVFFLFFFLYKYKVKKQQWIHRDGKKTHCFLARSAIGGRLAPYWRTGPHGRHGEVGIKPPQGAPGAVIGHQASPPTTTTATKMPKGGGRSAGLHPE